jgi:hypothetical protein
MKRHQSKDKKSAVGKVKNAAGSRFKNSFEPGEKNLDAQPLSQDLAEDVRESVPTESGTPSKDTTANWSAPEDRGEDLINERDPFMQQPERDTEIPPELVQQRAYLLYEQRAAAAQSPDNLADWFEAERQLRGEMIGQVDKKKKRGDR